MMEGIKAYDKITGLPTPVLELHKNAQGTGRHTGKSKPSSATDVATTGKRINDAIRKYREETYTDLDRLLHMTSGMP